MKGLKILEMKLAMQFKIMIVIHFSININFSLPNNSRIKIR